MCFICRLHWNTSSGEWMLACFGHSPILSFYSRGWHTVCISWLNSCFCCCSVTKMGSNLVDPVDARLLCLPLPPGVCSDSCPLSRWSYRTISSSAALFSCPQFFPASGSFPMSWLFASGGQNIVASASAPVLPMGIQGWFPLGLTGLISLQSRGLWRVFFTTALERVNSLALRLLYGPTLTAAYVSTGKTMALTVGTFVSKVMSLFFNTLSRFLIAFLPKSKHLIISRLQSPFRLTVECKKRKFVTVSIVASSICHEVMGPDAMILDFLNVEF